VPAANVSYNADAIASYGVGAQPSNWNIHAAAAASSSSTLQQVLAQVWPSAFQVGASGVAALNSSLLMSAEQTRASPQTIVYQINPRATWSDGTPITYQDFEYNWEAQSGKKQFTDVGGKAFDPVDEPGYDDIASVSGTAANPFTVTVRFSKPYPDWRSLFSYLVPAHIAKSVGFNSGFTDPVADLVSGGPFLVSELQDGYSLQLVRNARYWGAPANLSSVTYYFTSGPAEMLDAISAGQLDVASLQVPASDFQQLQATSGISVQPVASALYEDLDFNEAAGPFTSKVLREAVMMSVDRNGMASSFLGGFGLSAKPLENRVLLPGAPGYFPDGDTFDQPAPSTALQVLAAAGYNEVGGRLRGPDGAPVVVTLSVDPDDFVAAQLADGIVAACVGIGMKVKLVDSVPAPPASGGWEMALERRQVPEWPSSIVKRYVTGGAANIDGYSSAAMDALVALVPTTAASELPALYDRIDAQAWKDFVDLPLVQLPVVFAVKRGLLNLEPGPYYADLSGDEQEWGFAS